jgi:hypothetical protein
MLATAGAKANNTCAVWSCLKRSSAVLNFQGKAAKGGQFGRLNAFVFSADDDFAVGNRALAQLAKLAGGPGSAAAGIRIPVRLGALVLTGQPLLTVHAESPGALAYAIAYADAQEHLVTIQQPVH